MGVILDDKIDSELDYVKGDKDNEERWWVIVEYWFCINYFG